MKPDLEAIRARAERASPAPWEAYYCQFTAKASGQEQHEYNRGGCGINGQSFDMSRDECNHPIDEDDLEFMAHSRADIPALLAYIDSLERVREAAAVVRSEMYSRAVLSSEIVMMNALAAALAAAEGGNP